MEGIFQKSDPYRNIERQLENLKKMVSTVENERSRSELSGALEGLSNTITAACKSERVLEDLGDIILWEADLDLNYTYFSGSVEEILGYAPRELVDQGMGRVSMAIPEDQRWMRDYCRNEALRKGSWECSYKVISRTGKEVWLRDKMGIRLNENGEPVGLHGFMTDFTDEKHLEEYLRETEKRYRIASHVARSTVWDWDLLTDHVTWNENLTSIFLHPKTAMTSSVFFWYDNIHPDDRERVVSGIHNAIDGGAQEWADRYRFRTGYDSYLMVEDRGWVVRNVQGRALRMVGSMQDISEQTLKDHEKEEDLIQEKRARQQFERTLQMRDELMDAIVHDLKNPLSSIVMNASLMRRLIPLPEGFRDQPEERDNRLLQMVERIHGSTERMRVILQDAVDLLKSISGKLSVTLMNRDVGRLLKDSLIEVEPLRAEKAIEFTRQTCECDLNVIADTEKCQKIFTRFLEYALRISPPNARLRLIVSNPDAEIAVKIQFPRGVIPLEKVQRIFEREGKKVELPLVRGLVQTLGGRVWAKVLPEEEVELAFSLRTASTQTQPSDQAA